MIGYTGSTGYRRPLVFFFYRFESRLAKVSSAALRGLWFRGEQAYRIVGIAAILAI